VEWIVDPLGGSTRGFSGVDCNPAGQQRIMVRRTSQFDKNFARAFVEVPVGVEFDHAETLARIQGPVLFLNAQYFMRDGRLLGALTDDAVERVKGLVKGRGSMSGWTVDMVFRWKLRKRRRRRSRLEQGL
jgi:hypothetical protein